MNARWIWPAAMAPFYLLLAWMRLSSQDSLFAVGFFFLALVSAGQAIGHYRTRADPPPKAPNPNAVKAFALAGGVFVVVVLTIGAVSQTGIPWWSALLLTAPVGVVVALSSWPRPAARHEAA